MAGSSITVKTVVMVKGYELSVSDKGVAFERSGYGHLISFSLEDWDKLVKKINELRPAKKAEKKVTKK